MSGPCMQHTCAREQYERPHCQLAYMGVRGVRGGRKEEDTGMCVCVCVWDITDGKGSSWGMRPPRMRSTHTSQLDLPQGSSAQNTR